MKVVLKMLLLFAVMSVLLIACYPRVKILARYPDGKVKVERHEKLFDTLQEIYIVYYHNGKKKEADYWHNRYVTWAPGNSKSWYESGAKAGLSIIKYKDTALVYNPKDSSYTFTGLTYSMNEGWYENGNMRFKFIVENGKRISLFNNEKGDSLVKGIIGDVRPDGYDTIIPNKMNGIR